MKTDWNQIRGMMNAAIDACERIEASGCDETDRDAAIGVDGQPATVHDLLVSAWTYPENIRYRIIRDRHAQGTDLPYVPESARILIAMAQAGAELIEAGDAAPAGPHIKRMVDWFEGHFPNSIETAVAARRNA